MNERKTEPTNTMHANATTIDAFDAKTRLNGESTIESKSSTSSLSVEQLSCIPLPYGNCDTNFSKFKIRFRILATGTLSSRRITTTLEFPRGEEYLVADRIVRRCKISRHSQQKFSLFVDIIFPRARNDSVDRTLVRMIVSPRSGAVII